MDTPELNPKGHSFFADLVPSLIADYKFKEFPEDGGDFSQGMKFVNGVYVTGSNDPLLVSLTLYKDCVVADTNASSAASDEFLCKVLESLPKLGLSYSSDMVQRKVYLSQLFVRSSINLGNISDKINAFAAELSQAVGEGDFRCAAFELWPRTQGPFKLANFSFQRKIGDASGERYWSQAALRTRNHIEILEKLEGLFL